MDDLRTKYRRARQAKNQANLRAREERRNAEASLQAEGYWRRRAAEANAQTTATEREARSLREAVKAKDRAIQHQLERIRSLEIQLDVLRVDLRVCGEKLASAESREKLIEYWHAKALSEARRPWWQRFAWWPKSDGGR